MRGLEQQDRREMRVEAGLGVAGIEGDELRAHGFRADRRHDAEIALALLDRQHLARRLDDLAHGERGERALHGGD